MTAHCAGGVKTAAACSFTGVGENIMRAALARKTSEAILKEKASVSQACQEIMQSEILDSPPLVSA